jgi:hypothetical protein
MVDISTQALIDSTYETDDVARGIAAVLSTGTASPLFLKMLAAMIDPDRTTAPFPFRLSVRRRDGGNPKKRPNYQLAEFMVKAVDREKLLLKVAIHKAQKEFGPDGTADRTCKAALALGREMEIIQRMVEEMRR